MCKSQCTHANVNRAGAAVHRRRMQCSTAPPNRANQQPRQCNPPLGSRTGHRPWDNRCRLHHVIPRLQLHRQWPLIDHSEHGHLMQQAHSKATARLKGGRAAPPHTHAHTQTATYLYIHTHPCQLTHQFTPLTHTDTHRHPHHTLTPTTTTPEHVCSTNTLHTPYDSLCPPGSPRRSPW